MAIFTSYYSNRALGDRIKFSISRSEPKGVTVDFKWSEVAPSSDILFGYKKGAVSEKEYTERYLEQLRELYAKGRLKAFIDWASKQDKDVVLLCWEAPSKFCHRHILAEALNKAFNTDVKEL